MASDIPKVVPLTCHGHSRPVPHINFSSTVEDDQYYLISACKGKPCFFNVCCVDGEVTVNRQQPYAAGWYNRIGTFLGHKGAVWQARLSADANIAATAAADFSAKVWDTHSGECLHTLQHSHICRSVAFPNQPHPRVLATGGAEKKLRIFDLSRGGSSSGGGDSTTSSPTFPSTASPTSENSPATSYEIGPGIHNGTIKSIVWNNRDYNVLTTAAEDRKIRWWDLRSRHPVSEYAVDGPIGSCELNSLAFRQSDPGILAVAAGKSVYLFDGVTPGRVLKKMDFQYDVASVAVNSDSGKLVTGNAEDTWARVYDLHTDEELEVQKGHHGPIWSVSFSPDGKLYGTGSEDGTIKLWKACRESYGLWR